MTTAMTATITATGQTFPVEGHAENGLYLRIMGHARFFALHLLTIA